MKTPLLIFAAILLISSACETSERTLAPTLKPTLAPIPTPASTATSSPTSTAAATATATPPPTPAPEPLVMAFSRFENAATVRIEGEFAVITSNTVPNHPSPYFYPRTDPRYEPYNGTNPNFLQNPNVIYAQQQVFRIPLKPIKADINQPTPLGPIGVSINGVPFFNQYAAGGRPLTFEINSFDQYNGHPQMFGQYHYHVEPLYLTAICGRDAILGYLLDGFPVYGPMEDGKLIANADMDANHGHSHATKEYPDGIYHYHVTSEAPYISGVGYYGKAVGSVGIR